tara:strand:+ start:3160 stop:3375 length:216 start_codon:yes stop_codon:yes gene_type:complete
LTKTKVCTLEINFPKKISFIEDNLFEGEIINKDSCYIKKIDLEVSPNLESIADYAVSYPENIQEDKKSISY